MSPLAFAALLIVVGAAVVGSLIVAFRSSRWRRTAIFTAIISLLAAVEVCAILLDVNDVLEP